MNVIFFVLFFFNVQSSFCCLIMDKRTDELCNKVEEFLSGLGLKSSVRPTTEKSRLIIDLSNTPSSSGKQITWTTHMRSHTHTHTHTHTHSLLALRKIHFNHLFTQPHRFFEMSWQFWAWTVSMWQIGWFKWAPAWFYYAWVGMT